MPLDLSGQPTVLAVRPCNAKEKGIINLSRRCPCYKIVNSFQNTRTVLNVLFPGSFLDPLHLPIEPAPETKPEKTPGALLSTDDAAEYLAISAETLRRLCRRKAITFIAVTPHEYRFDLADLDEYRNSRRNHRKSAVKKPF
jgi:excisionase family DNA binding protein